MIAYNLLLESNCKVSINNNKLYFKVIFKLILIVCKLHLITNNGFKCI